jgi:acyl carrier protein phosphodiesterase
VNYLGHFLLSYPREELVVGNFIADFVKGKKYQHYPSGISQGILMHRFIDEFTDTHEASLHCKMLLYPVVGKLAGVALDVLYDHILAKHFFNYTSESLQDFADACYHILSQHKKLMPLRSKYILHYMQKHNWLCRYDSEDGIQTTLKNMSRRITFDNNLLSSWSVYIENEKVMQHRFENFFNDLQEALRRNNFTNLNN